MEIFLQKAFARLLFWLLEFLDAIFEMFRVLCGIEAVEYTENGETVSRSIVEIFIQSSAVTKAFLMIFLVAIIVCAFSVVASVVKNAINLKGGERKSHLKTVGQGFGSIIVTVVMAFVMIVGIWGSNAVLEKVYVATSDGSSLTIANRIFDMCVTPAYIDDFNNPQFVYEKDAEGNVKYEVDSDGNPVYDESGNPVPVYVLNEDGTRAIVYAKTLSSGWKNGYSASSIVFGQTSVNDVFGVRGKDFGLEQTDEGYKAGQEGMLELSCFNFWVAYFVTIMMLVALIWSMLGLVKRMFDLVALFIMLPLLSATIPLDDGARFKSWRETVVSKVILASGAVISVNIFLLVIPIIQNINFASLGWTAFTATIFKMFMLIGGALCINGGQLLLARLFGTSAEESREMAQSARALMSGAAAAGGLAHGVKNGIFGGTNKYGRQTTGALPMLGKVTSAATNAAGNLLGGNIYRGAANTAKEKVVSVGNLLRGVTKTSNPGLASSSIGNVLSGNKTTGAAPTDAKQGALHNGLLGAFYDKQAKTAEQSTMLGSKQDPLSRAVSSVLDHLPTAKGKAGKDIESTKLGNLTGGVLKNNDKSGGFKPTKKK